MGQDVRMNKRLFSLLETNGLLKKTDCSSSRMLAPVPQADRVPLAMLLLLLLLLVVVLSLLLPPTLQPRSPALALHCLHQAGSDWACY